MKTTGVSCVPKFWLLVFLGHPTSQGHVTWSASPNWHACVFASSSKWVGEPDYRGPGWLEEQGTSGREAICGLSICLTADCSGTQLMDVHVGAVWESYEDQFFERQQPFNFERAKYICKKVRAAVRRIRFWEKEIKGQGRDGATDIVDYIRVRP